VQGISTRNLDELVKALGMSGISKSPGLAALCGDRRARQQSTILWSTSTKNV
jgi:hypothetical protein